MIILFVSIRLLDKDEVKRHLVVHRSYSMSVLSLFLF